MKDDFEKSINALVNVESAMMSLEKLLFPLPHRKDIHMLDVYKIF